MHLFTHSFIAACGFVASVEPLRLNASFLSTCFPLSSRPISFSHWLVHLHSFFWFFTLSFYFSTPLSECLIFASKSLFVNNFWSLIWLPVDRCLFAGHLFCSSAFFIFLVAVFCFCSLCTVCVFIFFYFLALSLFAWQGIYIKFLHLTTPRHKHNHTHADRKKKYQLKSDHTHCLHNTQFAPNALEGHITHASSFFFGTIRSNLVRFLPFFLFVSSFNRQVEQAEKTEKNLCQSGQKSYLLKKSSFVFCRFSNNAIVVRIYRTVTYSLATAESALWRPFKCTTWGLISLTLEGSSVVCVFCRAELFISSLCVHWTIN